MSRDPEEVNKLTESTYKNVMEQFNPGLRNLVNLGKNYEKAVNAMVLAGRAYYDGVAKIGEIATASPVSKELELDVSDNAESEHLIRYAENAATKIGPDHSEQDHVIGHVLVEISSTHKKLNDSLDESFKTFHKEIISELEKKTELDVKYMNATLKRYQTEHRSKLDSLEKSQAELKKIKRKSQGGRNVMKYETKEMEYLETVSSRQSDIQRFIAEGCREALLEEKRRFCFLVDKHCSLTQHMHFYHKQCADLLNSKLPGWQEMCSDATQVPEKVMNMIEMKMPGSTPISGTPQPSPVTERNSMVGRVPPAPTARAYISPLVDMFKDPPAVPKIPSERLNNSAGNSDDASLSRSTSVATGLNILKRQKVITIFPHTSGTNKTLLSFAQGDVITLLIAEEKDGWLYGEHDLTKVKGWFPSSYTKLLEEPADETVHVPVPSPAPVRSISSVNLADKGGIVLPPPDYLGSLQKGTASDMREDSSKATTVKAPVARPESTTPIVSQNSWSRVHTLEIKNNYFNITVHKAVVEALLKLRCSIKKPVINGIIKPPFLSGENPFITVKLRPTVTNDRSAPIIR